MVIIEWNDHAIPHVVPGTGPPLLCDFLVTDVQNYWPRIEEITAAIKRCRQADEPSPASFYGNAYELELGRDRVTLTNLLDDSIAPESLPFSEFAAAFDAWVAALRSRSA